MLARNEKTGSKQRSRKCRLTPVHTCKFGMMLRQLIDKISIRRKCPLRKKKRKNTFKGFNNGGDNIENSNMPMSWGKEKECGRKVV